MKRIFLTLAVSLALLSGSAAKNTFKSTFAESFPTDTEISWQDGMFPIEDGKCFVNLYNNANGIYFQILVKDRRTQALFLNQGLTLYFDLNGKQKKKYSLVFPTMKREHKGRRTRNNNGNAPQMQGEGDGMMMPPPGMGMGFPGQETGDNEELDTTRIKKNMPPRDPKARAKQLKTMLAKLSSQPVTFKCGDEDMLLPEGTVSIATSGSNIVYSGTIPYSRLGKLGKKGEIAIGISSEPASNSDDMPAGPPPMGMTGGPGGGGMMPPGGMGGGPGGGMGRGPRMRGDANSSASKSDKQTTFSSWSIFQTF